jgi:hypothetical protein
MHHEDDDDDDDDDDGLFSQNDGPNRRFDSCIIISSNTSHDIHVRMHTYVCMHAVVMQSH